MANFCLPSKFVNTFKQALKSGDLDPDKLRKLSSDDRRSQLAKYVGDDNAKEVNALFEEKLLLKDQQKGLQTWARNLAIPEETRKDILDKISGMNKVLQPKDEQSFLKDLAEKQLGFQVNSQEAKQLFAATEEVKKAQKNILKDEEAGSNNRMIYGQAKADLLDLIDGMKPGAYSGTFLQKAARVSVELANTPRSFLTLGHLSAPGVQGWGTISSARGLEGIAKELQYFVSEDNYKDLRAYILSHPNYDHMKASGLSITDLSDNFTQREEAIQSTLLEKLNTYVSDRTPVPNLVRASNRAFTGYLNYVRFNTWNQAFEAAKLTGEDGSVGSQASKDIASVVNNLTGRGNIGKLDQYSNTSGLLNAIFFSPRKISAMMNMFSPAIFVKSSATARMLAARNLIGSLVLTGTVLGLSQLAGAKVDWNPEASDFGKVDIDGTKFDFTGGNANYLRLLTRLWTGHELTSHGKDITLGEGYKPENRAGLILQFLRNREAPTAGTITDALVGQDPIGRPFDIKEELQQKYMPIAINSLLNFYRSDPKSTATWLPAITAMLGVSVESPLPPPARNGMNVWGQPQGFFQSHTLTPLDREFQRIGYVPGFPSDKINGVKLSERQYDEYAKKSGLASNVWLSHIITTPAWQNLSIKDKISFTKSQILGIRSAVQAGVIHNSQGTVNDILKQSLAAKLIRTPDEVNK